MKILIITSDVGITAPGIVFERLINGFTIRHEVDLVSADYSPSTDFSLVKNRIQIKVNKLHPRLFKLFVSFLGINPLDLIWKRKILRAVNVSEPYDLVLSLISFHHYSALIAGEALARKYKKSKFIVYSVDAIPAPIGWSENDLYYRKVRSLMSKYISQTHAFFTANEQMLDYQLTFAKSPTGINKVLYVPTSETYINYDDTSSQPIFLYTGGIYQLRKVDYILKAFEQFINQYPNSKFLFVGSKLSEDSLKSINSKARTAIEIHPFTRDLEPYYKIATALIDIDAELDNDVYLSSKIINYLSVTRVIISETGINSPSRKLFAGINSIIQCSHEPQELFCAMKKAYLLRDKFDFNDRKIILEKFRINNIIEHFIKSI